MANLASMTATEPFEIVVEPSRDGRSLGSFKAYLGSRVLCVSRTPFLSAARVLRKEGVPPDTVITMRHAGSPVVSLRSTVGHAAKLTVREDHRGARFVPYRPPPRKRREWAGL